MAQYINKAAVVAEIDRRKEEEVSYDENGGFASWADRNHYSTLDSIQEFLDTLEVKEVDLKKKLPYDDYKKFFKEYPNISDDWGFEEAWTFAEYFFELGLKTADLPT